ncbi:hypothetical protein BJ546DRAFT_948807 [Cryomyces antarcticus]
MNLFTLDTVLLNFLLISQLIDWLSIYRSLHRIKHAAVKDRRTLGCQLKTHLKWTVFQSVLLLLVIVEMKKAASEEDALAAWNTKRLELMREECAVMVDCVCTAPVVLCQE